jgi:hypothetical protein
MPSQHLSRGVEKNASHTDTTYQSCALLTLGSPKVLFGERQANIDPRPAAVLAYLAHSRPNPVSRDELAEVFYPQVPPSNARHSISQIVHSIRMAEPTLELLAMKDYITIGSSVRWDVDSIESLLSNCEVGQAMQLVRGAFLATVDVASHKFEDWRSSIDSRIVKQFQAQLPAWIEECCFRADRKGVRFALQTLNFAFGVTSQDLQLPPTVSDSVNALANELAHAGPDGLPLVPLIGRRVQHRALKSAWASALAGSGSVQLVLADAGLGKTRLCTSLVHALKSASTVSINCYESMRNHGFATLRQALQHKDFQSAIRSTPDPWRSVIGSLLDEAQRPSAQPLDDRQMFLFEAMARLI